MRVALDAFSPYEVISFSSLVACSLKLAASHPNLTRLGEVASLSTCYYQPAPGRLTFADADDLKISITGAVTGENNTIYLPFSLTLDTNLSTDALTATAVEDGADVYVAVSVAKLLASTTMNLTGYVGDNTGVNPLTLNQLSVNLELDKTVEAEKILSEDINSHFKSAALAGDVTIANESASFNGEVELKLVKLISGFALLGDEISPISIQSFRVGGEFIVAESNHSFSASASVNVANASSFDIFAWSDYSGGEDEIYAQTDNTLVELLLGVDVDAAEEYYAGVNGDFSAGAAALNITGDYAMVAGEWKFLSPRTVTAAEYEAIGDAIRAVLVEEFDGNMELANALVIRWINVGGNKFDGAWIHAEVEFPELETAENFMKASFTLSAKVSIPDLAEAQVTTTVNRTAFRGGSVRANVKWNGGNYTLLVSSDDLDAGEAANLRLFNAQGYELNVDLTFNAEGDLDDLAGKALINGDEVGDVEFREGRPVLVFPNGDEETFESLF